jgi:hypothetical protein
MHAQVSSYHHILAARDVLASSSQRDYWLQMPRVKLDYILRRGIAKHPCHCCAIVPLISTKHRVPEPQRTQS